MRNLIETTAIALLLAALACGCGDSGSPAAGAREQRPGAASAETKSGPSRVASIVFVGQKIACDCTRERIDKTWQTLEDVLQGGPQIPVKRIQLDVDEAEFEKLDDLRSLMVPPGIYLFDAGGGLVDMLQGEIEDYRLVEVLR